MIIFRRKVPNKELTNRNLLTRSEVRQLWEEDKDYGSYLYAESRRIDEKELGGNQPDKKVKILTVCKVAGITLEELRQIKNG